MKKMKMSLPLAVLLASSSCAAFTPPPRFSAVSPADEDAPEAPPPPPLPLLQASPRPSPTATPAPHVHEGHR
jgi:hypothetical protein